jgi:hypothetical protein
MDSVTWLAMTKVEMLKRRLRLPTLTMTRVIMVTKMME